MGVLGFLGKGINSGITRRAESAFTGAVNTYKVNSARFAEGTAKIVQRDIGRLEQRLSSEGMAGELARREQVLQIAETDGVREWLAAKEELRAAAAADKPALETKIAELAERHQNDINLYDKAHSDVFHFDADMQAEAEKLLELKSKNISLSPQQKEILEHHQAIGEARQDIRLAQAEKRTQKTIDSMYESAGLADKPAAEKGSFMARHKILTGLGALGAGGLALNAMGPSGRPVVDSGSYVAPEEAGARAAMMDVMSKIPQTQIYGGPGQYQGALADGPSMQRAGA